MKYFCLFLAVVIMIVVAGCSRLEPDGDIITTQATIETTVGKATEPDEPLSDDLVWIVEPTLEYDIIMYCSHCDVFFGHNYDADSEFDVPMPIFSDILDYMGQPTGELHESHAKYSISGGIVWVYDHELKLFGWFQHVSLDIGVVYELYPMSEFAERFPEEVNKIKTVRQYDTTVAIIDGIFSPGDGYSGTAVAYGNEFVTDFVYPMQTNPGKQQTSIMSIHDDDRKYGIIDENGHFLVPLGFGLISTITETTAFVNSNGKWGIIDIS